MLTRLNTRLRQTMSGAKTGIIPYVTIGFPTLNDTIEIVRSIETAGADAIELGVPYCDPVADGPTIQYASHKALSQGVTTASCIELVSSIRNEGIEIPIIFMGYFNPILSYGITSYAKDCATAGVDAIIVPDLPPDESQELRSALNANQVGLISLLAPTSSNERIELGARMSDSFIYCVSVAGVTGARSELPSNLNSFISRVREQSSLPIAIGFGIADKKHVETVGEIADIAIVGSALINVLDSAKEGEVANAAYTFVSSLTD